RACSEQAMDRESRSLRSEDYRSFSRSGRMNQLTAYLVSVGATAGLSLLVVFILVAPMKRILRDVCGTDDRGNFWTIFSCLLIVLSTLLFCLFQPPLDGSAPTTAETFSRSIATLRMGLFGLLA